MGPLSKVHRPKDIKAEPHGHATWFKSIYSTGFQFCKMKRVLEVEGGDNSTKMWIYFMPQNCTLNNG